MFKNNRQLTGLATVIILLLSSMTAYAERLIPFQGRLTDGTGQLIQGVERVTFVIYDEPTGGTALWNEVHDNVSIIGGQVNVLLGSTSNLDDLNNNQVFNENNADTLDFSNPRYLGITIGVSTNQEMLPRHQLVPSFHARMADQASNATLADRATIATNAELLGGLPSSDYALATGTGDTLTQLTQRLNALDILVENTRTYIVPTGTVMSFAGEALPAGEENDYYFCEGQLVTYQNADGSINTENQALWNIIKFRYGKQDLSGTGGAISFRLPDYRGTFLRGWANGSTNDPDRASRIGLDIDGNAVTGDFVGTNQGHELGSHNHTILRRMHTGHAGLSHGVAGAFSADAQDYYPTTSTGGTETRPINTSVRYIIKR